MKHQLNIRLLIASCAISFLSACSQTPESTIENFYSAIESGEITEAKGYLSSQILGLAGEKKMVAALTQQHEKILACDGIKSIEIDMKGEGELRSGKTTITFNGTCRPKVEKTKMIEEDGVWKITASK